MTYDLLEKIWVINLKRQPEKKLAVIKELTKLPLELQGKVNFLEAVDGDQLDQHNFTTIPEWRDPFHRTKIKTGEIGCALSHLSIWDQIKKGYHLILEDDICISDANVFTARLTEYLNFLKNQKTEHPDLIYLHRKLINKNPPESIYHSDPKLTIAKYSYWTCAYMLSPDGARKLIETDYQNKIIPVDEFLPIMYGSSNLLENYQAHYPTAGSLVAVASNPSLLGLMDNAFGNSATIASRPYQEENNRCDNLEIWGIGSDETDGRIRFKEYCQLYGLNYHILGDGIPWKMNMSKGPGGGQKINILKRKLADDLTKKYQSFTTDIIVVSDTYDVIPLGSPEIILKKYRQLVQEDSQVIFSAEKYCWPHKELADQYPTLSNPKLPRFLNSGGFMGTKQAIWNLLKDDQISDSSDDQGYWTKKYLQTCKTSSPKIILDSNSEIFQTLGGSFDDLKINNRKSIIQNRITGTEPCFLHGNGAQNVKLKLNQFENYLGNHWNHNYGYIDAYRYETTNKETTNEEANTEISNENSPKIFVALFGNPKFEKIIIEENKFNYPQSHLLVKTYSPRLNIENGKQSFRDFVATDCQYYFGWEIDKVELTDPEFLNKMLLRLKTKRVVGPFLKRESSLWSNFWGAINPKGWYQRSDDYLKIVQGERKGLWNVPYLTNVMLIDRQVITGSINGYLYESSELYDGNQDVDMNICRNLRNRGFHLYVDNLQEWGYIFPENQNRMLEQLSKSLPGQLTVFDYQTRRSEWEQKYLHPEYLRLRKHVPTTEICSDAYVFPMFTQAFCQEIINLAEAHGQWSPGNDNHRDPRIGGHENVPTKDIHLNQFGFEETWKLIIKDCFAPLVSTIYSPYKTKGLNIAFVVKYSQDGQKELNAHHDASTYTLNLALNQSEVDYQGGGCEFIRQKVRHTGQKTGYIAVHPGRLTHYHKGLETTSGTRYILVSFIN